MKIRCADFGNDWKIARFSSQDKDYLFTYSCCDNPECLCRDMTFVFSAPDDEGDDEVTFLVTLNVETWEESKSHQRPAWAQAHAREFVALLTAELKKEFREVFDSAKKHERKKSEFRISSKEIKDGRLVSYSEVVGDHGSILKGGRGSWMNYSFDGVDYLVEDCYCVNPTCHCRNVHLTFLEVQESPLEIARILDAFEATMTLKGRTEISETFRTDVALAEKILRAWKEHKDVLSVVCARYKEIKAIGRRKLADGSARHNLTDPIDPDEADPETEKRGAPLSRPAKVGRNEPCPCGSGKKFKKCCGR